MIRTYKEKLGLQGRKSLFHSRAKTLEDTIKRCHQRISTRNNVKSCPLKADCWFAKKHLKHGITNNKGYETESFDFVYKFPWRFCTMLGVNLASLRPCNYCGRLISLEHFICPHCGAAKPHGCTCHARG